VSVQAERSYLRAVSVRYAMLTQLKLARIEFEKMKKLVERDKQANKQLADKQAQRSMDELATMRHSWRHA
jgi:flagellar biosynthesis chaperone FliJ